MGNPLDLAGKTFGRWHVLYQVDRPTGRKQPGTFWKVRCTCGNVEVRAGGHLNAGRGDAGCAACRSHGATIGGMTPEYQSWRGMRERCLNPKHAAYSNYGGRGITVCPRWVHSFDSFLADMGARPKGYSLDRIDNQGNYEPANCRWADAQTQARNSRNFILTDTQVAGILALIRSGALQRDIADALGVSRSHIANIASGHSRSEAA